MAPGATNPILPMKPSTLRTLLHALPFVAALSLPPVATAAEPEAVLPPRDASWRLVWSDEFDRNGPPDPKVWKSEQGFCRNEELQWYQPQNAVCRDGLLVLEARKEQVVNPNYDKNSKSWRLSREKSQYTSGSLITQDGVAWKYGRLEIRARFNALPGLWPAIWTTGAEGKWPGNGEIDIMEYYGDQILANTAHVAKNGKAAWHTTKHPMKGFNPETWNEKFHLWVMEWDEKEIAIYLDGKLLNRVNLAKTVNQDGSGINPFHAPHQLRLNLAIGGAGGNPDKTPFPQRYEIDYVRVYQK